MDKMFSPGDTNNDITNANANDDPGDQALIDLLPIPPDSQTPDTSTPPDPFAGIFDF